ncbi:MULTISPECIES: hypothetical protein [Streptomyces]|uniref:Uncharacterized protein n=1 Tax=Streptomyces albidocamelliae TaxID=2981135 RepID=A0ABY6ENL3_9ACTN|nr:hypothetical protein [Streptomyces sp. HUAS 14-6]UXY35997.1 hypothetical protein N8I86_15350 [Streptomyces sp. HUAS 14-6]
MPGPRPTSEPRPAPDTASDVIRWAAFSCVLVPVVLLWYGTSLAGATGTALGLAAVTAVCRLLLRRSERCAAHRPERCATQRGGRHTRGHTRRTPVD